MRADCQWIPVCIIHNVILRIFDDSGVAVLSAIVAKNRAVHLRAFHPPQLLNQIVNHFIAVAWSVIRMWRIVHSDTGREKPRVFGTLPTFAVIFVAVRQDALNRHDVRALPDF